MTKRKALEKMEELKKIVGPAGMMLLVTTLAGFETDEQLEKKRKEISELVESSLVAQLDGDKKVTWTFDRNTLMLIIAYLSLGMSLYKDIGQTTAILEDFEKKGG